MVGKSVLSDHDVVCGFLTMTVPALKKTPTGYVIPKFLVKKTGDEPVCSAEWTPEGPEKLVCLVDGKEQEWLQDTDINFDVSKEKELYLISYDAHRRKSFFKIKAEGVPAREIHEKFKKGDKVVIFGHVASIGRNTFLTVEEILKVET